MFQWMGFQKNYSHKEGFFFFEREKEREKLKILSIEDAAHKQITEFHGILRLFAFTDKCL